MALEKILKRNLEQPEQMAVQADAMCMAERCADIFIARYVAHPQSFNGHYVCTDLFKELFPVYSKNRECRGLFNTAVHNSAAVLASEQFRRVLAEKPALGKDIVVLLTGIPGAGIGIMSTIQGGLPDGLLEVQKTFGNKVSLRIFDNRDLKNTHVHTSWQDLDILRSEGNQTEIKKLLTDKIEQYKASGQISEACYRQAMGLSPQIEKQKSKDRGYGD